MIEWVVCLSKILLVWILVIICFSLNCVRGLLVVCLIVELIYGWVWCIWISVFLKVVCVMFVLMVVCIIWVKGLIRVGLEKVVLKGIIFLVFIVIWLNLIVLLFVVCWLKFD